MVRKTNNNSLLLSIIILTFSCNLRPKDMLAKENSMIWKITKLQSETGGIGFDYNFKQYHILNDSIGFILGNNLPAEVIRYVDEENRSIEYNNIDAILFKTIDGGESFKRITVGKGSLSMMVSDNQNNLYAIKRVYTSYPQQYDNIILSRDLGETWKEISSFNGYMINTIRFYNELIGIVCLEKKSQYTENVQLFKTLDGGKSWKEVVVTTKGVDLCGGEFKNENELYTFKTISGCQQPIIINLSTGDCRDYGSRLEEGYAFSETFHNESTGELYSLITKSGASHKLKLFNHSTQKVLTFELEKNKDESILDISISDNFIGVLWLERDGSTFYKYSSDLGENWIKEKLPTDFTSAYPTVAYGKGLVWGRSVFKPYSMCVRYSKI